MQAEVVRDARVAAEGAWSLSRFTWALGGLAAVYGLFVLWRLWLPLEINGNEPWNAYHIDDAFSASRLYPAPETMINNYTPLSYYVLHALSPLFPNAIVAGRVLSLLSILFLSLMSFRVARELGAKREPSLFAAIWFSATLFRGYTNYAGMNDPHLFGLALMAAGFLIFLRGRATRAVYGAFAVFILAGLAKNSLFALPLAAVVVLFAERNARRYRVLAFCALGVAVAAGLLYGLYGPAFFSQIFMPRILQLSRIAGSMQRIQWIAIALAFWLYAFRRLPIGAAKTVTAALVVSGLVVWWGTGVAEGVGTNAIFELVFAASVALACAASVAGEDRLRLFGRPFRLGGLVYGLILIRLLASLDTNPYALLASPSFRAEIDRRVALMLDDVALVKAREGRVTCSVMTVCYLAGKPYDLTAPSVALRRSDIWPSKP